MKKSDLIRLIAIPLAFIAIVAFAFIVSPNTNYVSEGDILSVRVFARAGEEATLGTPEGIHTFVEWLALSVPKDEFGFVRETDQFLSDTADWTMTVDQVPDGMKGFDTSERFTYSVYHMYVYLEGGALYYNGVLYDLPDAAASTVADLLKEGNG